MIPLAQPIGSPCVGILPVSGRRRRSPTSAWTAARRPSADAQRAAADRARRESDEHQFQSRILVEHQGDADRIHDNYLNVLAIGFTMAPGPRLGSSVEKTCAVVPRRTNGSVSRSPGSA